MHLIYICSLGHAELKLPNLRHSPNWQPGSRVESYGFLNLPNRIHCHENQIEKLMIVFDFFVSPKTAIWFLPLTKIQLDFFSRNTILFLLLSIANIISTSPFFLQQSRKWDSVFLLFTICFFI